MCALRTPLGSEFRSPAPSRVVSGRLRMETMQKPELDVTGVTRDHLTWRGGGTQAPIERRREFLPACFPAPRRSD